MKVIGPVHTKQMFSWNHETKTAVCEISDFGHSRVWGRLFDDACDEGFQIITNGKAVAFYLSTTDTHNGEITAWNFFSIYSPEWRGWKVVVFND